VNFAKKKMKGNVMRAYFKRHAAAVAVCTVAGTLLSAAAFAQHEGMNHGNSKSDSVPRHNAGELAPLKILMPANGDIVGSRLAIVFETRADLAKLTMGQQMVGAHLHVEAGDTALMPSHDQLIRLGANRYLFLFDLPARPGNMELRVSWAGADHKTIESSVQKVTVTIPNESAASR
jgi:hypothetical protein